MTDTMKLAHQVLEALEIGHDAAWQVAVEYHAAMKGYRQAEHDAKDADVAKIADAIAALRAALAAPAAGMQMVPIEPTPEMLASVDDEAGDKYLARGRAYSAWKSMIAASKEQT